MPSSASVILRSENPKFWSSVQELADTLEWQSPLLMKGALLYQRQRPLDEGKKLYDHSFILLWENKPVILFIGAAVESDGKIDLLAYEVPCISIEDKSRLTTKAAKTFLKEFDRVTEEVNGSIYYRDFLIEGELSILSQQMLSRGTHVKPGFCKTIDFRNEKATQKSNIRKSYKSLINWGLRELQPQVYDASNITWEHMNNFRQLHIREAGRETRSEESWRRQFEMVQVGEAFSVLGNWNGELVSAGFFPCSKTNCYYGVSASRRDLFEKPLFHALMWSAILHAQRLGCRWFEVGELLYLNHSSDKPPSKKELGISEFKAGFGGETRILLDLSLDCS